MFTKNDLQLIKNYNKIQTITDCYVTPDYVVFATPEGVDGFLKINLETGVTENYHIEDIFTTNNVFLEFLYKKGTKLEFIEVGYMLTFKSGKTTFNFENKQSYKKLDFDFKEDFDVTVDADVLNKFIPFVGNDDIRPALKKIDLNENGIFATNGHIMHYNLDIKSSKRQIIEPSIVKFFHDEIKLYTMPESQILSNDRYTIRLCEDFKDRYPNALAVIPTDFKENYKLDISKTLASELLENSKLFRTFDNIALDGEYVYNIKDDMSVCTKTDFKCECIDIFGFNIKYLNVVMKTFKLDSLALVSNAKNRAFINKDLGVLVMPTVADNFKLNKLVA